jgi:hypothetical protein
MSSGEKSSEPWPQDRGALLTRLAGAHRRVEQTLSTLSPTQLTALRDQQGWSIKDHLAHLVVWQRGTIYLLQRLPRSTGLGIDEEAYRRHDGNELNTILHQQTQSWSLDTVLAAFSRVHQDLLLVLIGLSDDDLHRSYIHYQPHDPGEDDGTPILAWVAGIADHQEEHLGWMTALASSTPVTSHTA